MAVNACNALAEAGCEVHLCLTRTSGPLVTLVDSRVNVFVLGKKSIYDVGALLRLRAYVVRFKIDVIHAHSTSLYFGVAIRVLTRVRLVWHDHNGMRPSLNRVNQLIRLLSRWVDAVFCANEKMRVWAVKALKVKEESIYFLPNFPGSPPEVVTLEAPLPGQKGARVVCTANLRDPKDHATLIKAIRVVCDSMPSVQLLLIGSCADADYVTKIRRLVNDLNLVENVHFLGQRMDVVEVLKSSVVGVISSESEGLPVALLEYGVAGLGVVSTDVGECGAVLGHGAFGVVIPPKNPAELAKAISSFLSDENRRSDFGRNFKKHVELNYSEQATLCKLQKVYSSLI